jgi:O-antigen/teichoic acid export membrane protein
MANGDLGKTLVQVTLTFLRQSLGGVIQIGVFALISYKLGAEGAGMYAVALMLPSAMSEILNLGLPAANIYFGSSRQYSIDQIWTSSVKAVPLLAIAGVLVGAGLVGAAGQVLFPGFPKTILYTAILLFPLMLSFSVVLSFFLALQRFSTFNLLVLIQPIAVLVVLLPVLVSSQASLQYVFLALFLAHSTVLLLSVFLLSRHISVVPTRIKSLDYLKVAFRYGIAANISNTLAFLNYRLDLFLVNFFAGASAAGVYNVAVNLAEQLWIISKAYTTVLFPVLSSFSEDEKKRQDFTSTMSWSVLWITAIASVVLGIFAGPLISLVFGAEFEASGSVLYILLPGVVIFSSARVLANDFASRGMVGYNLAIAFLVLIVNTCANLVLIPKFGFLGAAFATSFAYTLNLIVRLTLNSLKFGAVWWTPLFPTLTDLKLLSRVVLGRLRSR